jgi:phenylpyruvate tautomerase PptA (4-oxalocrotonate tautomerase family)
MPLVQVTIFEDELSDEVVPNLIGELTDAVCKATREEIRPAVWVLINGIPAKSWGAAGKPLGS